MRRFTWLAPATVLAFAACSGGDTGGETPDTAAANPRVAGTIVTNPRFTACTPTSPSLANVVLRWLSSRYTPAYVFQPSLS